MSKKIWQGIFSALLLLGLALSQGAPDNALASSAEIDAQLLAALEESGQANFFVVMTEKADLSAAFEIDDWNERGWYVYNTLLELSLRSQVPVIEYAELQDLKYKAYVATNAVYIERGNLEAVQDLASLPGVAAIELERIEQIGPALSWEWSMPLQHTVVAPHPEAYGWNLDVLNPTGGLYGMQAAQVWSTYGVEGDGIVVGNIDTGGMYDHNALVNQYRGNLGGGTFDHNYNWWDPINNNPVAYDDHGHGSGTIGIMSGETPDLIEQIGVAPGTKWIACKGCNSAGGCPEADLLECFDFHLAPWDLSGQNPDPTKRAHIVNNSWGGSGCSTTYQAGIQAWVAAGMFPAFSAGNTVGCGTVGSPGDNPEVFGTAAHDTPGLNIYAGGPSCFFPTPTCDPNAHDVDPHLNAPTYGRTADNCQDCYYNLGGTSGASPHTAGAVALIWSGNPSYIGDIPGTFYILEQSTNHDYFPEATCGLPACAGGNTWPNNDYGWGYLDALAAVTMAGVGGQGWLDGTITEAGPVDAPGDPLAGITVFAERQGGGSDETTTDVTGYYTMTLNSGTYTVTASGPQHTAQTTTGVVIVTGTLTTENFQLVPMGLMYGYVTDADNGFGLDAMVVADDGTMANTNPATGYYEMYLDAGSYVITATVTDYAPGTANVNIVPGGMLQQDFALLRAVSFVPTPLHVTVDWQGTTSTVATLTNNNPWSYDFEFMEIPGGYTPGIEAAWPGPDGYGYVGEVVDFDWIDIAATGTPVLLGDDDWDGPFPVGFDFPLYANIWPDFYIGSNGFVSFGVGATTLTNQCPLPNSSTPNNIIPILWDDLDPGDTGDIVYYQSFGACPVGGGSCLVVQYEDFCHYPGGATCTIAGTFEVILFENGSVLIQFEDAGAEEGSSSTTGIENNDAAADYGLTYACNTASSIYDGLAMCFVYPGSSGCLGADIPWFGQDPISGTVPAMDSINPTMYFTATFAAGIDQPGDYYATLLVKGDPSVRVPVTMTVLPAANMGLLEGTVTSNRPGGPLEAGILIDDGMGMTWELVTDPATGYYSFWLDQGNYDVTASAAGYVEQTAGVVINPAATTTQDFELQLDAPWIDVMPTSMQATVELGTWTTDTLTIYNDGLQTLDFDIGEVDNGFDPAMCVDALCEEIYGSTASQWGPGGTRDRGNIFEATEDTVISEIRVWLDFSAPTDIYFIVYEGTGVTGSFTKIFEVQVFDVGTGAQWHSSGPINVPAEAGKFYYVGASWNGAALYWRGTEPVPITTNCFGILHTGIPGDLAGYPPAPTGSSTYTNFSPYHFAIVTGGGDVPWLSEDPITGTVPAGNWLDVEVTFDATVVAEPGDYYAELRIGHNDPLNDDVTVPVTMTVEPTADTAKLQGWVNGLGYCDADYYPLEEAEVYIEASSGMTWTRLTDADGYYYLWLNAPANSPVTLTVTYPEHEVGYVADVELTGGMTTTVDFDLRWLMPCVSVAPDSMHVTLDWGLSTMMPLTLTNWGAAPLNFEFREADRGFTPGLLGGMTPKITLRERLPNYDANAMSTEDILTAGGTEPMNLLGAGDVLAQWPTGDTLNWGDGFDLTNGTVWINDNAAGGGSGLNEEFTVAGTRTGMNFTPSFGGTWPGDMAYNPNTDMFWQVNVGGDNCIYEWDPSIPAATGNSICGAPWTGISQRGLAYDPSTDTFFIGGWNEYIIYHFDNTGTLIQQWNVGLSISGLAYNFEAGLLFVMENSPTDTVSVFDVAAGTVVDSFTVAGFGNYVGAGLAIDCDGNLWATNQGNNNAYLIDSGVPASQCAGGEVPWLFEDPMAGSVPGDGGQLVADITFDSSVPEVLQPGDYYADLIVSSDDPGMGNYAVPVTMTVLPSADLGKLEGTVTGLGYCDLDPAPLEGAEVVVESSAGAVWTLTTDVDGYYTFWLLGAVHSPMTVTTSYPDHEMGMESGVVVSAQMTTTVDFNLRWLMPCVSVDPDAFDVTVGLGYSLTHVLELSNAGAAGSDFGFREMDHGFMPGMRGTITWLYRDTEGVEVEGPTDSGTTMAYPSAYRYEPEYPSEYNVLVYTDDWIHVTPNTLVQQALAQLGLAATVHVDGDYTGFIASLTTGGPWDMVIWSGENFSISSYPTLMPELLAYVQGGGKLAATYWRQLDFPTDPLWTEMGFTYISNYVVPPPTYWWDPGHPLFNNPESAPEWLVRVQNSGTSQGTNLEPLANGLAMAGYTTTPSPNEAGIILRDDGMTIYKGLRDVSTDIDDDDDGLLDGVELWENIMVGLLEGYGGDIPWLFEDPVTGTVGADTSFFVDLIFDASVVTQTGTYSGTLVFSSDDPVTDTIEIPVTMNVVEPAYGVDLSGDMAQEGVPGEVVVYTLTVTNLSNGPMDTFSVELGSSVYTSSLSVSEVGPLAPGGTAEFYVMVTIPATALVGEFDMVEVTVTSQGDPTQADMATLTTSVGGWPIADLAITKVATPDPVIPGETVTYTLDVVNNGPDIAVDVMLTDTLPAGVTFVSASAGCVEASGVVSCDLGNMATGESASVVIVVTAPDTEGVITNTAEVGNARPDPDLTNNTASVDVDVVIPGYQVYLPFIARN